MSVGTCRLCGARLDLTFIDLGCMPLANAFLKHDDLGKPECRYPLHVYVCEECYLVQLDVFASAAELFSDYAYFSSYSETWLKHCEAYADHVVANVLSKNDGMVVEIASNDGCLLRQFLRHGCQVMGVEPAVNVAQTAIANGTPTRIDFFGEQVARQMLGEGLTADLLVANNVLAHVPDLNDFVAGMKLLLAPDGVICVEFPHLLRLIQNCEFDTIYHEHFSYFSLSVVERLFNKHALVVFDVQEHPVHGGSLRVYAAHKENSRRTVCNSVQDLKAVEDDSDLNDPSAYVDFAIRVESVRDGFLSLLEKIRNEGKSVVAYGAPAKGNTLLNYCGIGTELIEYTVDRSPHKQGLYLPGSRIPIYSPDRIRATKPDYILLLPWNLKEELIQQLGYTKEWGGKFILPIPYPEICT